ncbi:MAG TPA: SLC13 family permease [Phycisphaerales bacterium]|nr:SLC13 family permease [Phycisphaerales bacterium]
MKHSLLDDEAWLELTARVRSPFPNAPSLTMTTQAWITLGVLLLVLLLMALTGIGADLIMIAALTVLLCTGVLTTKEAFSGFANEGMLTVGVLFVIAAAIRETGGFSFVTQRLLGRPKTVGAAQSRMMFPIAIMSGFMNNTPLVAMMLPVVSDWCKKLRMPPSKLMMPLSFATILGGLCTLIGTSTNVVVNGLFKEFEARLGAAATHPNGMGMFGIALVGLPCAVAGLAYMLFFSKWLLPNRQPAISQLDDPRQYTVEMLVEENNVLVGKTIEEAGLRHLHDMYLMEIDRDGEVIRAVGPEQRLLANDRLVFVGVVDSVAELQKLRGLRPATDQVFKLNSMRFQRMLVEAVVSNSCRIVGQTIRESRFRTLYNAVVIAVARNGERIRKKIGDIEVEPGDTLLLEAEESFLEHHRNSRDFYLVSQINDYSPPRYERAGISLLILTGMVVAASFEWLDMLTAALIAAGLLIVTRCCSATIARRSIDWQILTVIGASFGLGKAMEKTLLAEKIASSLVGTVSHSPHLVLAMVYACTMIFTELMSNNAAAVLMFPIAVSTAAALHVSPLPFIFAITIAASCGFATPIGYQTNLMVYGPGGYKFLDYLRFGGPLNLLVGTICISLAPVIWPFHMP